MLRLLTFVIFTILLIAASEGKSDASINKNCKPVDCGGKIKTCPYGYQKKDGCEICKCNDPCNPPGKAMLCGANKRCFIDKQTDGVFVARCGSFQVRQIKDVCEREKAVGNCKGLLRRFYYDSTTEKCEPFIYGGCGGNRNNFKTIGRCQRICMNQLNHV